jgi:hypothetical protein
LNLEPEEMMPAFLIVVLLISGEGYTPLPPDPPLARAVINAPPFLARGQILQLWGHSQWVAMTDRRVPSALKLAFSFDAVIAVPLEAHNSMCSAEGAGQQCDRADMLTREQFNAGVSFTVHVSCARLR